MDGQVVQPSRWMGRREVGWVYDAFIENEKSAVFRAFSLFINHCLCLLTHPFRRFLGS